jgi:hypothetical protein
MSPSGALQQVDDRIAALQTAMTEVEEALVDLDGDEYRRLLSTAPLTGDTAARWAVADAQIKQTWKWFLAIKDWMGAIVERRGTKSSVPPDILERLTDELARSPSDILPGTPGPGSTSEAPSRTVEQQLAAISAANEQAHSLVGRIAAIWEQTATKLGALESDAGAIEQEAAQGGLRAPNDIAVAKRLLDEVRKRCSGDPLSLESVADPTTEVAAGLQRARAEVEASIEARRTFSQEAAAALSRVQAALAELHSARRREAESAAKVSGSTSLAGIDRAAASLQQLLDEIQALQAGGAPVDPVRELTALRARLGPALDAARGLAAGGGASLAQRNELRGRLDAYHAKALALGRAEDSGLDGIYRQARDALFTAPCDLQHCESLVLAYQRELTSTRRAVDA